jgi:integrase
MANIRPRKDKHGNIISYQIRVFKGRDENGKQLKPYTMTWEIPKGLTDRQIEKQLNKAVVLFEQEIKSGRYVEQQTFAQYAKEIIRTKKIKHSTRERYYELLERIIPAIGFMKLSEIRPTHLNKFYHDLSQPGMGNRSEKAVLKTDCKTLMKNAGITNKEKLAASAGIAACSVRKIAAGDAIQKSVADKFAAALNMRTGDIFKITKEQGCLSEKTVLEHHRLISTVMTHAEKDQLITFNPASKASPPKQKRSEPNYIKLEDLNNTMACLDSEPAKWRLIAYLFIFTGCRRAEIAGLKWNNVLWEESKIEIDHNLLYTPKAPTGKGEIYEDTAKTERSHRKITVPIEIMEALEQYREEQEGFLSKTGVLNENNYIFIQEKYDILNKDEQNTLSMFNKRARPMHPDSITDYFDKFSIKYNLPHLNPHAFRHTHISLLLLDRSNNDIMAISRRAGHANLSTTLNIYGHLIQDGDQAASNSIRNMLLKKEDDTREPATNGR